MTNHYTSIELARLIHGEVPEVETGAWYATFNPIGATGTVTRITTDTNGVSEKSFGTPRFVCAYRLDDVLRAIKVWGEKNGKMRVCADCGAENIKKCHCYHDVGVENWDVWHSHRLLTAYLADNGFGERTEEVIRSIFEEV